MPLLNRRRPPAFSLVELMVILAVLAFLLGMLLMSVSKVRSAAARTQCSNNLRQLALAMHNANDAYNALPPTVGSFPAGSKTYGTYFFFILPFIEQAKVYQQAKGYVWKNRTFATPIPTMLCPSDASAPPKNLYKDWLATCNYPANWLILKKGGARIPASFPDGTSNTIVHAERYQMCNGNPCGWGYPGLYYWTPMFARYSQGKFQVHPAQEACDPGVPQSPHASGINIALGDGSVRFLSPALSPETWWYACTPNGGEVLGADWND
jgi:type II secretory pathway pseudopilin PulG